MSSSKIISLIFAAFWAIPLTAADIRYENGVKYYQEGQYREAIVRFESLLTDYPDIYQYHQWAGRCYVKLDNPDRAMKSFQTAFALAPGNRQVALDYARILIKNKDYKTLHEVLNQVDEEKILEEIKQIQSELDTLHYLRGLAAFHLQNYSSAAADFSAVSEPEKRETVAYHHTYALYREKLYEQALERTFESESNDPGMTRLVFQIIFSVLQPGSGVTNPSQYCGKAEELSGLLDTSSSDTDVTYWAGRTLLACDRTLSAVPLLRASADGGNVYAAYYLSYALMKTEQYSDALKYMDMAESGLSGDPGALKNLHCNRGRIYHSREQFKKALEEYERGSCSPELIQQAREGVKFRQDEKEKERLLRELTCLEGGTICICPKCGTLTYHYSSVDCSTATCTKCGDSLRQDPCPD